MTRLPSDVPRGHFAVYVCERRHRFVVPITLLDRPEFRSLLWHVEEEFGFTGDDGKITLPCDAAVMEYAMCLVRRDASEDVVRALLSSMVRPCHTVSGVAPSMELKQQLAVCV